MLRSGGGSAEECKLFLCYGAEGCGGCFEEARVR
jgi:hypothetical protein